ncbi:MAG: hypothetical protein M2R45_04340 [Verrucomicrobia subdivision 3 bacterium]|nr:hypothetical protein [Limisphaerales bacterium]MCS1416044.1 hypothetical protein [Limisphaerales bacterium]
MYATDFLYKGTESRKDNQWLAIREPGKTGSVELPLALADSEYSITLCVVVKMMGARPIRCILMMHR